MTYSRKGYKQTPEHVAKRTAAVRLALQRPEVKAKMVGHECSPETRSKIGAANSIKLKGRKLSDAHRANMSKERIERWKRWKADPVLMAARKEKLSKALKGKYTGALGSQWKGGVTQGQRESRPCWAWHDAVLKRDNYTCQICDQYGGDMHVDHIKPWAEYPELRFEVLNGRTLCRPCHYYVTFKKKLPANSRWGLPRRLQNHKTRGD